MRGERGLDSARSAGRDALSLWLIDSRNRLLQHLAGDESPAALRQAARAGWFQEQWVACNLQRSRGERCDPALPRLASCLPQARRWLADDAVPPPAAELRAYLETTIEATLDLLAGAGDSDDELYVYRLALWHEDRVVEALLQDGSQPAARPQREPLWLPAQRLQMGSPRGGFVPHGERWAHEVRLPETEIDAQPVNWSQYLEFAEAGGYDRRELWSDAGWLWLQASERRAPRGVEQLSGAVVQQRGAALKRVALQQPVVGVSRHEAEAWCRWAGRRLPTEPEWEAAALGAGSRAFAWGEVLEWVAGSARLWPGAGPVPPGEVDVLPDPADGTSAAAVGVLRGATLALPRRWLNPKARRFVPLQHDTMLCGFRSCAL